jgi:NAD(P)-dependent dehydrogenase (short-subunit alcohol dehydrogenase family)
MHNHHGINGGTFLVVGASSGIGKQISLLLAEAGCRVIMVARNQDKLLAAYQEMLGDENGMEVFDISSYESIPHWIKKLSEKYGAFDGMVNCAGKFVLSPLKVIDPKQAEALWRVNVFSNLWLAKGFRQRGVVGPSGGSIVFVSSVVGLIGQAGLSIYSASKGAILSMSRSLALELAKERIRVNCIAPSNLKTAMTDVVGPIPSPEEYAVIEREHPLGFGEPRDVAEAALYLLSPASRWVSGSTLVVDGGFSAH